MKAMLIDDQKNLVMSEVAAPVCKAGEVIIDVHAAALNRADLMQVDGNYPSPPGWPQWPGLEVSGVICETAPESRWKVGDKVCALLGGGGYAERVAVPEGMVLAAPKGLPMEEAAAIPEVFSTAYLNFFLEAGVKSTDTVFIQAGASGLGIASIQLLKNTVGCKIITTVGSESKGDFVRQLGADIVVNRRMQDLGKVLDENPIDIALDCVGGPGLGENIGKMKEWGRWILLAALGGTRAEVPLDLIFRKRLRLIGSTLRSRTDQMKSDILASLQKALWPAFESGELHPVICKTFPFAQANEAHQVLRRQENIGKVVLVLK